VTVKWRGKPVFIRHRTPEEIALAEGEDITGFRDPQTDAERVVDPKVSAGPEVCANWWKQRWWWRGGLERHARLGVVCRRGGVVVGVHMQAYTRAML
jgi:hypothetical protein